MHYAKSWQCRCASLCQQKSWLGTQECRQSRLFSAAGAVLSEARKFWCMFRKDSAELCNSFLSNAFCASCSNLTCRPCEDCILDEVAAKLEWLPRGETILGKPAGQWLRHTLMAIAKKPLRCWRADRNGILLWENAKTRSRPHLLQMFGQDNVNFAVATITFSKSLARMQGQFPGRRDVFC